ncbi:MAG: hypothetical protein V2B13_06090 [Pseudomonadota bacterium]
MKTDIVLKWSGGVLLLLIALFVMAFCLEAMGKIDGQGEPLSIQKSFDKFDKTPLLSSPNPETPIIGRLASKDFWLSLGKDGLGFLYRPLDRQKIAFRFESQPSFQFPALDQVLKAFQTTEKRTPWFKRHWLATGLFVLLTLYIVLMVGVSGGPNHGEHPLLLNLAHLIVFYMMAGNWPLEYYTLYRNLLLAAILLSFLAILFRMWSQTIIPLMIKMAMFGLYLGLFIIFHLKDL